MFILWGWETNKQLPATKKVSSFPTSSPASLSFVFLMAAILTGLRWSLSTFLLHLFSMDENVENFFKFLLAISSFEVWLFSLFAHLLMWFFKYLDFFVDSRSVITYQMYNCKNSLLFRRLSLHCQYLFFFFAEAIEFHAIPFVNCWDYLLRYWNFFFRYVYILKCFFFLVFSEFLVFH